MTHFRTTARERKYEAWEPPTGKEERKGRKILKDLPRDTAMASIQELD